MTRRPLTWMSAVLAAVTLSGCVKPLPLTYQPGIHLTDAPNGLKTRKIVVFDFVDDRDDMTPKAFGIEMRMATAELPIATAADLEADRSISEYISTAFKDELKSLGVQIAPVDTDRRVEFAAARQQLVGLGLQGVERVIVGRIRFFEWTQAGFSGLLFQAAMPKPRVNAEIQIQVTDPTTGHILWAGDGWALEQSGSTFPNEAEQGSALQNGLLHALDSIIRDKHFLAALT